jgi:DNA modification methylase
LWRIFLHSSEHMPELADGSVQLVATSPPYNVGVGYDRYTDAKNREEYFEMLERVWKECKRVLVRGGRLAVNIADIGRRPTFSLYCALMRQLSDLGFLFFGTIIWDKGSRAGKTSWGSWLSPRSPSLIDQHEYILVFAKDGFELEVEGGEADVMKEEFMKYIRSVWYVQPETDVRVRAVHPAPFPIEIPLRLIKLFTYRGGLVLDPFAGSGTTLVAAKLAGRHAVGYEISEEYARFAERRLSATPNGAESLDRFLKSTLDGF